MDPAQTSRTAGHRGQADRARNLEALQLQAYLVARETMRRLKRSSGPCFARDWRPNRKSIGEC